MMKKINKPKKIYACEIAKSNRTFKIKIKEIIKL